MEQLQHDLKKCADPASELVMLAGSAHAQRSPHLLVPQSVQPKLSECLIKHATLSRVVLRQAIAGVYAVLVEDETPGLSRRTWVFLKSTCDDARVLRRMLAVVMKEC